MHARSRCGTCGMPFNFSKWRRYCGPLAVDVYLFALSIRMRRYRVTLFILKMVGDTDASAATTLPNNADDFRFE